MNIEQIYTGCLAQGAYYIESDGEAAVIDPLREVEPYIRMANARNARIKYIFETHFHADFVSGHIDLASKTGAMIVYGPTEMTTGFQAYIGKDNEEFTLGKSTIRLIHTPGHTLESSCYLLIDEEGEEKALFTGDTLLIGDVGRPDLAQHVIAELTEEKLAGKLYDSLHHKIIPLNDDLIVYPGHGAGSACGKNMSSERHDTLGHQKQTNYALNPQLSKQEFIRQVLSGLTIPPAYFPHNVRMNIKGYVGIDEILSKGVNPLSAAQFRKLKQSHDVQVVDARNPEEFKKGFIPGSWNIGLSGQFASWVGALIKDVDKKILLVTDKGKETEAVTRLARVGFDNCLGFLDGGIASWRDAGNDEDHIRSISPSVLAAIHENLLINIADVRKENEFNSEHVIGAMNFPLDHIDEAVVAFNKEQPYYIHCAGGYRSVIFISILKSKGFHNLIDVDGGLAQMKKTNRFKLTEYVSPTSLL